MINETEQKKSMSTLLASLAIPLLIGGFSSFLTAGDMRNYEYFNHPPLSPPSWVFPVVWSILYVIMGLASYLVYTSNAEPEQKRTALTLYAAQLVMNMFWTVLFFTYVQYLIALIWLVAMWVIILMTALRFYKINRLSGIMMGVLLIWTAFAGYLNYAYYVMSITPMPIMPR